MNLFRFNPLFFHIFVDVAPKFQAAFHGYFFLGRKTKRKEARNGEEEKTYLLDDVVRQRITDVDFARVVQLPQDMDLNEWLATNSMYPSSPFTCILIRWRYVVM